MATLSFALRIDLETILLENGHVTHYLHHSWAMSKLLGSRVLQIDSLNILAEE